MLKQVVCDMYNCKEYIRKICCIISVIYFGVVKGRAGREKGQYNTLCACCP
jgi:hypothetical protein